MVSIVFATPLINLIAFLVLLFIIGWEYGLITIATWILIMVAQHFSSQATKSLKSKESYKNDER
jgi:hypothetical protein